MPMRERMRRLRPGPLVVVACTLAVASAVGGVPSGAHGMPAGAAVAPASGGQVNGSIELVPNAIPGQYIVRLQDGDPSLAWLRAGIYAEAFDGEVGHVYDAAIQGFSVAMSEDDARRLAAAPGVAEVSEDGIVHATSTTQT